MVGRKSRFFKTPIYSVVRADGTLINVFQRRIPMTTQVNSTVQARQYSRIDLLAYDSYRDATQWWAIADVSPVTNPFEITSNPGDFIIIPSSDDVKGYLS